MKLLLSEVFKAASKLKTKKERIIFLQQNSSPALKDIIRINFDSTIVSVLPVGVPPYKADDAPMGYQVTRLAKEFKQFRYFFKGPVADKMPAMKREVRFIRLLESLHFSEAEMLVLAKDKKLKYTGITKKLCMEAFPSLIAK